MSSTGRSTIQWRRILVQGVGFRPFINGQAARHLGLAGFVFNDSQGVTFEVEGTIEALDHFQRALREQAPPWRLSILLPARW